MTEVFPLVAIATIALLVAVAAILAIGSARLTRRNSGANQGEGLAGRREGYPKGHWRGIGMSIGIALGIPMGLPIGLAMDNVGLGIALGSGMGVSIGVAIGSGLERRHQHEIRPLTAEESRRRTWAVLAGLVLLVLGVLAAAGVLLVAILG